MKQGGLLIRRTALLFLLVGLFGIVLQGLPAKVAADQFTTRELKISESRAGHAGVTYRLSFSGQSAGNVGAIRLQFCSNDPFPGYPCTPPAGLDTSAATLVNQTNATGFSLSSSSPNNELLLTRAPVVVGSGEVTYTFEGMTNPSSAGVTYVRLETFYTNDTSQPKDSGGLAISTIDDAVSVRTYVPPYILFCIGQTIQPYDCKTAQGNYIDFETLGPGRTATAETKLLIATNAEYGYTIRTQGTTLTSGTNVIPALASPDVSRRGTSQFGLNLRANSSPPSGQEPMGSGLGMPAPDYNQPNRYKFASGDAIVQHNHPDNYRMYTANYIVNVSGQQPPGIYVSTITYIAHGTF